MINWKKVWREFDRWFELHGTAPNWADQKQKIELLVKKHSSERDVP
jgi:hypothetical protein